MSVSHPAPPADNGQSVLGVGAADVAQAGVTSVHVLRSSTRVHSQSGVGSRWCFYCRRRVEFTRTVHVPTDPLSYYGPHISIECERGHDDGDLFPGRYREWHHE